MAARGAVALKRVYDPPAPADGCRILVEGLWPRGLTREQAALELWLREIAPSTELRKWFDHDPDRWLEFKRRYFRELAGREAAVKVLEDRIRAGAVTLVFAARETRYNNAVALKEYVEGRAGS